MDWDEGVDFFEEDEPLDVVRAITSREPDVVTARPLSVLDVAAELLSQQGPMDTWKLQKLCYYAQAKHLAVHGGRLFEEPIEAWTWGPVVRELWHRHRRRRTISALSAGDLERVRRHPTAAATITAVLAEYGDWTGEQLSELTHREEPWRQARAGLGPKAWGASEISVTALRDYYRELAVIPDEDSEQVEEPPF